VGSACLLACLLSLGFSSSAAAFCRSTTIQDKKIDTCFACPTLGLPLAWSEPSIEYTFSDREFPELSPAEVRDIFAQGFAQWLGVSCAGEDIEIDAHPALETTMLGPRDAMVQPEVNVMGGYLSADEWLEQEFETHVFAQTNMRYYTGSGVIAGADIWVNGGIGTFRVCLDTGCPALTDQVDLRNVVTHEIGHVLGLEHSREPGATMGCKADKTDIDKRSLEQDDRDGLCAIYPPGIAFRGAYLHGAWTTPKAKPHRGGCSVGGVGSDTPSWAGLLGIALTLGRRRARST
jgi:hypothetical protein